MSQSIITNAVIASGGRVINAILGVVVTALLTRLFGPALFGTYTALLSYGSLLQLAADFGLYLTLTREIARRPQASQVVSHVLSLRLLLLLVVFSVGWGGLRLFPTLAAWQHLFIIAAAGLLFQSLSQIFLGVYQKFGVVWRATIGDLVGRGGQLVSLLGAVVVSRSVGALSMVASFSVGTALALLLHYLLLPRAVAPRLTLAGRAWQGLLKTSWPLGIMLLLNAIYFRVDAVILALFRTAAEVGHYGLAYRIIESGLFFPAMFGGLLLPRFSAAWQQQQRAVCQRLLGEALRVLAAGSGWCLLVLLLLPEAVVALVAGPAFLPAVPLLRLLSVALAIMFFGNLFGFTLVATNQQHSLLYLYAGLAVANTTANVLFIPWGGALAAAVITVVTELGATLVAGVLVWRSVGYHHHWRAVLPLFPAVALTAGAIVLLHGRLGLVSLLAVTTPLYLVLCWLTGFLSRRHLVLLTTRA